MRFKKSIIMSKKGFLTKSKILNLIFALSTNQILPNNLVWGTANVKWKDANYKWGS